ncbi:hypothetical protein GCM10009546_48000 [Actinomadura livida]|uniref:Oxidoreductase molybdopterin-binding domain-containing protein n=2 Tax=Actinomadura livida TaxID=79909 RepID=A0ABP3Q5Y8_9ACTN|nr:hypothetical protein GCM10010208_41170 [Actinomadura livida]
MIDLAGTAPVLSTWETDAYADACSPAYDAYMRGMDFSPGGSYFVVVTTGGGGFGTEALCDSAARWETGRSGLSKDIPWNPTRTRGHGVEALVATAGGDLLVGSDTDSLGGEYHDADWWSCGGGIGNLLECRRWIFGSDRDTNRAWCWNGDRWSPQAMRPARRSGFWDVAVVGGHRLVATGPGFLQTWDGRRWQNLTAPSPPQRLAAASATHIWGVWPSNTFRRRQGDHWVNTPVPGLARPAEDKWPEGHRSHPCGARREWWHLDRHDHVVPAAPLFQRHVGPSPPPREVGDEHTVPVDGERGGLVRDVGGRRSTTRWWSTEHASRPEPESTCAVKRWASSAAVRRGAGWFRWWGVRAWRSRRFPPAGKGVVMGIVSPGFRGRGRGRDVKLPPGQYLTEDFPVLSAGPTPRVGKDDWEFTVTTESGREYSWDWRQFMELPSETPTVDIHCVTKWSKLGTRWQGVSLDTLLADVDTAADYVLAHSYGGYTTNMPLEDVLDGQAWIAYRFDGEDLPAEHGGPARLLVPHLYFWKSAKWVRGLRLLDQDEPGFWETAGYHDYGDPWREQRYQGD